jgi:hypothetical protein
MPCTSVRAVVKMSTKLKNANQALLAKALEMMKEVLKVELVGTDQIRVVTMNGTVYIDILKDKVEMQGQMASVLNPKIADYYMAAIQVANLKKRQMKVSVETKDDRIRIRAE